MDEQRPDEDNDSIHRPGFQSPEPETAGTPFGFRLASEAELPTVSAEAAHTPETNPVSESRPTLSKPAKPGPGPKDTVAAKPRQPLYQVWWARVLFAFAFALAGLILSAYKFEQYGWGLFVMVPISLGFVSTIIYCRDRRAKLGACLGNATLVSLPVGALLFLVGGEGMICLIMASPLALGLVWIGSLMGYSVQKLHYLRQSQGALLVMALLASPLTMGFEEVNPRPPALGTIETAVEIAAPRERVWRALTGFPAVPPPQAPYFKAGIAYPIEASLSRPGVGGQLIWRFTTGQVVEQITAWKPGELLAYDVISEPEMMRELSPYELHPPHLTGFFKSRRGHFRLEAAGPGRTRLIGQTVYTSRMWPAFYWMPQAEWLHAQVQQLVMNNIKALAEAGAQSGKRPTTPLAQPKK